MQVPRVCLKRLVNTHTCVFAETHADTALSAHSLLRARATHRHARVLLARSQRKGEGPPPASRDVTWRLKQRRPPTIRGRVVSERDSGRRAGHILAAWCRLGASTSATTPHTTHATACCARRRLRCRSCLALLLLRLRLGWVWKHKATMNAKLAMILQMTKCTQWFPRS